MADEWITVTAEDIRAAAFGVTIPDGEVVDGQLNRLIAKAIGRLRHAVPTLPARVASGEVDVDLAKGVIEDMVLRVAKNPHALRSVAVDDFQGTIDQAVSAGALYVTDDEIALLEPASARGTVGTIQVGVPSWRLPRRTHRPSGWPGA